MGISRPKLLTGHVMHGRLLPRKNHFRYGIYYIAFPLSRIDELPIAHNKPGLMSFYDKDHADGAQNGLRAWAQSILHSYNISLDGEITLICMPRVAGYVFNPVSFWLCHDQDSNLKAVLCEVHNTFGEKHTYLCAHDDGRIITASDTLKAKKLFHVSPFLEREGSYEFRFESTPIEFKVWIDYFDSYNRKQLGTSLTGSYRDMTRASCRRVFFDYPLVTLKAILLIHYQAMKLVFNKIRYVPKPPQRADRVSASGNLTKI